MRGQWEKEGGGGSDEGNKGRRKGEEAVMKGTRGEGRGRRQ